MTSESARPRVFRALATAITIVLALLEAAVLVAVLEHSRRASEPIVLIALVVLYVFGALALVMALDLLGDWYIAHLRTVADVAHHIQLADAGQRRALADDARDRHSATSFRRSLWAYIRGLVGLWAVWRLFQAL